ncbi:MAG: Bug family tripartite tricarboxylate transporter substrate binding protein [Casimicrobium sp.]
MKRRDFLQLSNALLLCWAGRTYAQSFPNGPITVVLPLQAGSASDVAVRKLGEIMTSKVGAPLVVDNVVGAAGLLGLDRLSKAKNDGQTIAALNNSIVTILPHLQPGKVKIDTRKDMIPIAGIANIPTFFGVKKGLPFKNIADVVAHAKAHPDKLTYATGGVGSPQHLAMEMFASYAGVKLTHVPYKGASQATTGLVAGEVDLMTIALSLAQPFLPDKRIDLIGYCGAKRHAEFPNLATLQEQGIKGYDYSSWIALFAPKATPANVLETLRTHAKAAASDAGYQSQLVKGGLEPWVRDAAQLQQAVDEDYARWEKVIKAANIQAS